MATSLKFYADPALTTLVTAGAFVQGEDGLAGPADRVFYLGSPTPGRTFQASSAPGTAQIVVSLSDSAGGYGPAVSHVKLAATAGGLDSATPGASLNVGTTINGGPGNGVPVHVRVDTPALTAGVYNDLALSTNSVLES